MKFFEKKLHGKTIYDGKILKLEVDEVELPDGTTSKRECVRHSGGAAVLCVVDGKVLLVKQYRYLYGKEIYEIPAGKLERGEDPLIAAARELKEETGMSADLIPYIKLYPTPGYTDEIIHVYLAKNCRGGGNQSLDDGEFLSVCSKPLNEVLSLIESGEICDGKTVAAIYKFVSESN
ncbi:MAG: NUDIX hydrolase [Clostridia bacterium]|nr:NUDIX hydrolase [Clostridia bacterium]